MNTRGGTRLRAFASTVGRVVRDGWLIIGITLALFAFLEWAYRTQSRVRAGLRPPPEASVSDLAHPHAGEPWYGTGGGALAGGGIRFDPWRGWWPNGFSSRYMNVDSAGKRVTPQALEGPPRFRVFMIGGSTMWGWPHIDSLSIPAMVARALAATDLPPVGIENFAQGGYTLTHSLITFMIEVRNGNIPDVAIFLDGTNDIVTTWAAGRAGAATNEALSAEAFERGRRDFRQELIGLARHSRLVRRIRTALGESPWVQPAKPSPGVCDDVGSYYRNLVKQGIAIGEEFGIEVMFYFQPILAASRKPLTPWEESVRTEAEYEEIARRCAVTVDRLLADEKGEHFVPLYDIFDADTVSTFTDAWGHLTVYGNERVARIMTDDLIPALRART